MVGETSVVLEPGATVRPSISVGLAVIRPGETAEGVFHRADQMMYRHKRRTRVMLPEASWPSRGSDPKRNTSGRKSGYRPEVQSIF
jgi:GGDEF domain-containing protein